MTWNRCVRVCMWKRLKKWRMQKHESGAEGLWGFWVGVVWGLGGSVWTWLPHEHGKRYRKCCVSLNEKGELSSRLAGALLMNITIKQTDTLELKHVYTSKAVIRFFFNHIFLLNTIPVFEGPLRLYLTCICGCSLHLISQGMWWW